MSFRSIHLDDDDDDFFDAEAFFARSGEAVPLDNALDNAKGLSFDPLVEAWGPNGSLSRIPIAAHDGFHNCSQYLDDPYPSFSSVASSSLDGSYSSWNMDAPPKQRDGGLTDGAVGAADNVMQGPVLMAGMAKAAHYVASLFEDDDSEEEEATSDEDERGGESQRETPQRDESIRANRNRNGNSKKGGCKAHQSPAEKARAAK